MKGKTKSNVNLAHSVSDLKLKISNPKRVKSSAISFLEYAIIIYILNEYL
jgi:hypothetical protein